MKIIRVNRQVDVAQLRAELGGMAADVRDEAGTVVVDVPDDVDEALVERLVRSHFPRSLVQAIVATIADFDAIDYQTPTTMAAIKVELEKHRLASKRSLLVIVKALRARWE